MKRKNLFFSFCICIIIAGIAGGLLWGIHRRMERESIPVSLQSNQPVVALTFDDGPNPLYTTPILDILYEHKVPATFFLVGEKISANKLLIREMEASGHEIGSHTFTHTDLMTLKPLQIREEIEKTEEALKGILPQYTMRYVRPPYGHYTEEIQQTIGVPLALWTIDSHDWEGIDAEKIYSIVMGDIKDGDVVVFHDDNPQTVEALEKMISELKRRGFQFATMSQLEEHQERKNI